MLPKDLLIAKKYKPDIWIEYLELEKDSKKLAEKLISIFEDGIGETYKELKERADKLETFDNFKIVRGLFKILERRCTFKKKAEIDPKKLRSFLFLEGPTLSEQERDKIFEKMSEKFNTPIEKMKNYFWLDKEENKVLRSFDSINPIKLLKQYNLSLTQTLLFDAIELTFEASGNYQEIFRAIKYNGLMYFLEEVSQSPEGYKYKVHLNGPASIFRRTRKYGTSLAKVLPYILKAEKWKIEAKIETTVGGEKRIYDFELEDSKKPLLKTNTITPEKFDSATEESFAKRLKTLRENWKIKREPTFFKAGPYVFIPDFSFKKDDRVHYLEVVGFWTDEYISKKIKKVNKLDLPENVELSLAVNKNLKCTRTDFERENPKNINVFFYDREIPIKPIVSILDKMEEQKRLKDKNKLQNKNIDKKIMKDVLNSNKNIFNLKAIAARYGVDSRSLQEVLIEQLEKEERFVLTGEKIINKSILKKIKSEIDLLENKTLSNVQEILNRYDLNPEILEKIGYDIKYDSLDLSKVRVVEK